jgi:acyl-CoA thioesterase-1
MEIARLRLATHALVFAVLVSSCGSASPAAPSSPDSRAQRVVVLGDSLAVSPSRDRSFPAQLNARAQAARVPASIANAGVSGDTSEDGLGRLDAALSGNPDVLVLELGANDGLQGVDVSAVERNLAGIIERARARHVDVLLCGMETPPLHGFQYSLAFHGIFPRLAARYDIPLVPFLLAGVALNPDLNTSDGIHPNADGASRIADTVWPYLAPMISPVTVSYRRDGAGPSAAS